MTDDSYAGFTVMDEDDWPVEVVDVWPPGRFRASAMDAYDRLAREGEIRPQGALKARSGVVTVRYLSKIPDAWVHDLLRNAENKNNPVR